MPKRKRRANRKIFKAVPDDLIFGLGEAQSLMNRKRWREAREVLDDIDRRFANRPEVLTELVNVNYELNDMSGYQRACERLLKLEPDDPELTFGLASVYLMNFHPALSLRTFRQFLERWPDDEKAEDARRNVAALETKMSELLPQLGEAGEEGLEIAEMHEETQSALEHGDYARGRKVGERLLNKRPDFIPALNNLSQIYFVEGEPEEAIAAAGRVLELAPDNYHALSNIARYLYLSGRADEAKRYAAQLKTVESKSLDSWIKKVEALAYMGDDEGVLAVFHEAERVGYTKPPDTDPMLHHLAAVAAMRLGREDEARGHWRTALKIAPGYDLTKENLDDLKRPVGERHAPWPFELRYWIPRKTIEDLIKMVTPEARRNAEGELRRATGRYLKQHPEVVWLAPILFERGDKEAREFAMRLSTMAQTPEMLAALRNFALSQRGPDAMRIEAANAVAAAGLLPSGTVRLWMRGEWQEVLLLGFEIHGDPIYRHPPKVTELLEEAVMALHEEDADEAETLLKRALELEPDAPDILYNLTVAYEQQDRTEEAETLVREIHERHPDYPFARLRLVRQRIKERELDEANALLKPLFSLKRLHHSELAALCNAQIELSVAQKNKDAARSWLGIWAEIHPDHPGVAHWRRQLGEKRKGKFLGRGA